MLYDELLKKYNESIIENRNLKVENGNLQVENDNLKIENNNLKRIVFGSKSEKLPKQNEQVEEQCSLFDNPEEVEKDLEEQIDKNIEEITVYRKKKNKTRKAGIKRSVLKDIIIKRKEFIIEEGTKCPICNENLKNVGKKVVRQEIEFEPAKLNIKEYIKYVYKCEERTKKENSEGKNTFVETEVPKAVLPHSFISPSLATEVIYQKYYLGVPLYKQEKM